LPFELLERIDAGLELENARRAELRARGEELAKRRGKKFTPHLDLQPASISEMIRQMLIVGLDVTDGGDDAREWLYQVFADELRSVLAIAVHDKKARATLQRIAKGAAHETSPDFG
jgi:hypothetical protein